MSSARPPFGRPLLTACACVQDWGVPNLFLGTIVIPIVGNAAEHAAAIIFAVRSHLGHLDTGQPEGHHCSLDTYGHKPALRSVTSLHCLPSGCR